MTKCDRTNAVFVSVFIVRELVEDIRENPYLQYFIGMPGYVDSWPFVPSLLVEFRKRLTEEVLTEINEMIIRCNADWVEVERAFSLAKRSYGLGCIRTELADTTRCSDALGVMAMNIARLVIHLLC